ncbi:MAG: sulfite reductase subunit alpha [Verrucomicrobia bacterium]|nr:MAG: sulfite reductase subunit alpha [Verrucomicrobiota bacterium]
MSTSSLYSRKNPFLAPVTVNQRLTAEGTKKETRHFEISLEGSHLTYEVGDSLGVFPSNDPELVETILNKLEFSGEEEVPAPDGAIVPLKRALLHHYILTEPSKQLLEAVAAKDSSAAFLKEMLNPNVRTELDRYLWGRDVLDPLLEFESVRFAPEEFVKVLRKLQPRLYSIASSQKYHPSSVHLTVAVVRYESYNRSRKGVCTTFLSDRAQTVPVFVHSAKHFHIPEDPEASLIMVGPGTGVAPFRAFLQERKATGARGRNWLFFGEQYADSDFFYQEEFEAFQSDGVLTCLHTAFSRDQDYKIYVQHRMLENAEEIYAWLEAGAYFYVCGDAARMAKDVDTALHSIVAKVGNKTVEEAKEYIEALKKAKRYRRDVY